MAAIIQSWRNGANLNTGVSRDDLLAGELITVSSADTATTYAWSLVFQPEGSTASFSGDVTQQSPGGFTVDREGPYLVRLIVDLGLATEDTQFVRLRYLTVLGDLALVSAGETVTPTGSIPVDLTATGWANDQNRNLLTLLGFIQQTAASGRILYVDPNSGTEGYGDYPTVQQGIDAAVAAGAALTTPYIVAVRPGLYTEDVTFKPHVHVLGWPGAPQDDSRTTTIRTNGGAHQTSLASPTDLIILSGLTLENVIANTAAVLEKSGVGHLFAHRVNFSQWGLSVGQGPAVAVSEGTSEFDHCTLLFAPTTGVGLVAFSQAMATASTAAVFRSSTITGPSGMLLDTGFTGVGSTTLTDTDVAATVAGGVGINTTAGDLTIQYSRVRAPLGTPLQVNPTAAALGSTFGVTVRWSFFDGDLSVDVGGGGGTLSLGSVEYGSLTFPSGTAGLTLAATTKAASLYYDPAGSGGVFTSESVQAVIDEIAVLIDKVNTLDDAYDGGVPGSGAGRRIIADQGAVEIVDAASPSDPVPANITNGKLRVVGGVEVGAIGKPEVDLSPNPYGNGPQVLMGWTTWANGSIFGTSSTVMARATGTPLFRNYNLRLQTQSSLTGGNIGRVILRGGDGLSNGATTPDAASLYLQAGSGLDAVAGAAGDIYVAPGDSAAGTSGSFVLVRPSTATPASVTAAGVWVGGVTGDVVIATDMGAVTVSLAAADNLAATLAKFDATGHVVATQLGGVITLTSVTTGPTAEVYFLSADAGVDAALGVFNGQIPVAGTWPEFVAFRASAANEVTIGANGATGPMIYNADTGKLTVPGLIDPTGLILDTNVPLNPGTSKGIIFVGDGAGGTNIGDLYYRWEGGALQNVSAAIGGATGFDVQDNGILVPNSPFTTLNFLGAAVTATDGGAGTVNVTVTAGGGVVAGVARERFPAASFTGGAPSTHALAFTPDNNAAVAGLFDLLRNGVSDMTPVLFSPVTAKQWRINAGVLEIGTDITASGDDYQVVYPHT
jgi:hypothetical protein